ncbi:MAG: hypothetical protein M3Y77_19340 [Actinomycetota bacterium]|nr:hypothetical protein [Actinomycetota bacterium]
MDELPEGVAQPTDTPLPAAESKRGAYIAATVLMCTVPIVIAVDFLSSPFLMDSPGCGYQPGLPCRVVPDWAIQVQFGVPFFAGLGVLVITKMNSVKTGGWTAGIAWTLSIAAWIILSKVRVDAYS